MNDFLDLRIIKTRKLLVNAWFNLLENKKSRNNAIKITQICHKANITLITFYNHFNCKQAFFKFAISERLVNKLPIPKNFKPITIRQLVFKLFNIRYDFIFENASIFKNNFEFQKNKGGKYTFVDVFIEVVTYQVFDEIKLLQISISHYQKEILTLLLVGAILHCIFKIVKQAKNIDKKNILKHLNLLYNYIVYER